MSAWSWNAVAKWNVLINLMELLLKQWRRSMVVLLALFDRF
jgi:hypothetical protein